MGYSEIRPLFLSFLCVAGGDAVSSSSSSMELSKRCESSYCDGEVIEFNAICSCNCNFLFSFDLLVLAPVLFFLVKLMLVLCLGGLVDYYHYDFF